MSVVVRGIRIPESCTKCKFSYKEESYEPKEGTYYSVSTCKGDVISTNYYNSKTHKEYAYKRPDYCPIVEIPEKHGRLIDADKLIIDLMDRGLEGVQTDDYSEIQQTILVQDTVIEAED